MSKYTDRMDVNGAVIMGLRDGLGSEDIAIKYGVPIKRVRGKIEQFRRDGRLGIFLRTFSGRWGETVKRMMK